MIYGWSFRYDVGEQARNIEEILELAPLGSVRKDDPRLIATDIQMNGPVMYLWVDYRPEQTQIYRLEKWKAGSARTAQSYGESSLENKYAALEDAARAAIRAILRSGERNRPKEAIGSISLASFPMYWLDHGRWAAFARFRVDIREINPFAAY
jgi:Arc/MetJ family transcription regulator